MRADAPFEVLAEPKRRLILDVLRGAELPVGELVRRLALSQPLVSKHLRVLRDAGLVDVRTDAQRRIYRLRTAPLQLLDQWLEPYRQLWESRLDDLERHLDTMLQTDPSAGTSDTRVGSDTPLGGATGTDAATASSERSS